MSAVDALASAALADNPSRSAVLEAADDFLDLVCDDSFDFEDDEDGTASTLMRALYWALYDCHLGLWSLEYRLACRCGIVYRPGLGDSGPEEWSDAFPYYQGMCAGLLGRV